MSTTGLPENASLVSTWPQQEDPSPENYRAIMESLLKGIKPALDGKVSTSQRIKERFWLADILRKQGEYDEAMDQYSSLLKYAYDNTIEFSDTDIGCLSRAFIDYVDCGRFSPKLPLLEQQKQTASNGMTASIDMPGRVAHLLETAERGIAWLQGKGKLNWAASLQLERALLLKSQGKLEEALREMKEAHQKREAAREAPGYSFSTHKLELADLLYATANGGKDDKLFEAANLISAIHQAAESTLKERMLSSLVLAKIRKKQGEENTANDALGKAQKFAYEMERAAIAENSRQVLGIAYQDAKKLAEILAELDQKLQTVKGKVEETGDMPVHPATVTPAIVLGESRRAIPPRHISCYVSLPQNDDIFSHKVLLPALRQILEFNPFYWQVGCRNNKLVYRHDKCNRNISGNNDAEEQRDCWLRCSDMFIADIKDWSPDVVVDLGIIYAMRMIGEKGRLSIILKPDIDKEKQGANWQFTAYKPDDFGKAIPIPHDFKRHDDMKEEEDITYFINKVKDRLVSAFNDGSLRELNEKPHEHFLSPVWIAEKCRYPDKDMTEAISNEYITMEAFREAIRERPNERFIDKNAVVVANKLSLWRVTPEVIKSVLNAVTDVLGDHV